MCVCVHSQHSEAMQLLAKVHGESWKTGPSQSPAEKEKILWSLSKCERAKGSPSLVSLTWSDRKAECVGQTCQRLAKPAYPSLLCHLYSFSVITRNPEKQIFRTFLSVSARVCLSPHCPYLLLMPHPPPSNPPIFLDCSGLSLMSFHIVFVATPSAGWAHIIKHRATLTKSPGCWFLSGRGTLESGLLHWANCSWRETMVLVNFPLHGSLSQRCVHVFSV